MHIKRILPHLAILGVLAASGIAKGQSTYQDNILSIPQAKVNGQVYKNVSVSIGDAVMSESNENTNYGMYLGGGRALLPQVIYKNKTYFNVNVSIDKVYSYSEIISVITPPSTLANYSKYSGATCVDGLQNSELKTIDLRPLNPRANTWSCNVVRDILNNPIREGNESLRFELRDGDCSVSVFGYDDCKNDRIRVELYEHPPRTSDINKVVRYSHSLFVPSQNNFYAAGLPISIFAQVASDNSPDFVQLLYLHTTDGKNLMIRFHRGWTYIGDDIVISNNLYDVWHDLTYEISGGIENDNYVRVYLNGKLVAEKIRDTLADNTGFFSLKLGIYDPFVSRVTEEIKPKYLFHDSVSKTYVSGK